MAEILERILNDEEDEQFDSDEDDDDIDWWDFGILGVERERGKDGKKLDISAKEKRHLMKLIDPKA